MTGLAHNFRRQLAKVIAGPGSRTGSALAHRSQWAQSRPSLPVLQDYVNGVIRALTGEVVVVEAFFHVWNTRASPITLFHPHSRQRLCGWKSLNIMGKIGSTQR